MIEESIEFHTPKQSRLEYGLFLDAEGRSTPAIWKHFREPTAEVFQEIFLHRLAQQCPGVLQIISEQLEQGAASLVFEMCPKGSIADWIKQKAEAGEEPFSEDFLRTAFTSMLQTLGAVHKINIAMRNIDCSNWLVMGDSQIRLSDFGDAILVESEKSVGRYSIRNREENIHAEAVERDRFHIYTQDYWALGKVFLEMLSFRRFPTLGVQSAEVVKKTVKRKCVERGYAIELAHLIIHMLTEDRLHVDGLLQYLEVEKTVPCQAMRAIDVRDILDDAPTMIPKSSKFLPLAVSSTKLCATCEERVEVETQVLSCSHTLCAACLHGVLLSLRRLQCPTCSQVTTMQEVSERTSASAQYRNYVIRLGEKYG